MFLKTKDIPLDAGFDDREFENIFLHNRYPGDKNGKSVTPAEKAELWALYDAPVRYNGINMLRELRSLWGIHLTLKIGPRSGANKAPRGVVRLKAGKGQPLTVYFEGYSGNISDATRDIVAFAPYGNAEKSRALSQKFFIRLVVPLKGLSPLMKIESLLMAYSLAASIDKKHFAGIVDPDIFLFVPPTAARAGLAHYHREDRLLNTHLVSGFNFYDKEGTARFFTHGLNRFGLSDILIGEAEKNPLTTDHYATALRHAHGIFLKHLMGAAGKEKLIPFKTRNALPQQVGAMLGKNVAVARLPVAQG